MRNVSDKSCRENQNTHFVFSKFFFFENSAVYEIMCENIVQPGRPQMTIWRVRITRWIPKATDTHSEYVILISFPLQQLLNGSVSMLRNTYISSISVTLVPHSFTVDVLQCIKQFGMPYNMYGFSTESGEGEI
jgi:hypothetical protein